MEGFETLKLVVTTRERYRDEDRVDIRNFTRLRLKMYSVSTQGKKSAELI